MSKPEEETPLIYREAVELLEDIELRDAQIQESESLLEAKEAYYLQLQKQCAELEKAQSQKEAQLAMIKRRTKFVNNLNTQYRKMGQEILVSCHTAAQECKDLEGIIAESDQKVSELEKNLSEKNARIEKEIDDLTKLLNQLTEKRKKQLEAVELEAKRLEQEDAALSVELSKLEYEEKLLDGENLKDSSTLEQDVSHLRDKLKILDEEYLSLVEQDKSLNEREKEIRETFSEEKFGEMNQSFLKVSQENEDLQRSIQDEQVQLNLTLEEQKQLELYEQELDKEIAEAKKGLDLLDVTQSTENSKWDRTLGKIRADIAERTEKFEAVLKEKTANVEILKETELKITELTPKVDLIATELGDVEKQLNDLEAAGSIAEQFDATLSKVASLDMEIATLEQVEREKENLIETHRATLAKNQQKFDLELLTLTNAHLMEIREIEEATSEYINTKAKLNEKVNSLDDQIKELEENIKKCEADIDVLKKSHKKVDDVVDIKQQKYKNLLMKNRELRLDTLKQPKPLTQESTAKKTPLPVANTTDSGRKTPTKTPSANLPQEPAKSTDFVRKTLTKRQSREKEGAFSRPKTPQPPKLPIGKGHQYNWDSDTSVEEERIHLRELLARRKKRRQSPE